MEHHRNYSQAWCNGNRYPDDTKTINVPGADMTGLRLEVRDILGAG
jgi:hypothetical protein